MTAEIIEPEPKLRLILIPAADDPPLCAEDASTCGGCRLRRAPPN